MTSLCIGVTHVLLCCRVDISAAYAASYWYFLPELCNVLVPEISIIETTPKEVHLTLVPFLIGGNCHGQGPRYKIIPGCQTTHHAVRHGSLPLTLRNLHGCGT